MFFSPLASSEEKNIWLVQSCLSCFGQTEFFSFPSLRGKEKDSAYPKLALITYCCTYMPHAKIVIIKSDMVQFKSIVYSHACIRVDVIAQSWAYAP